MPEKDPLSYTLLTYIWVIGISLWGGIASYIRKVKSGINPRFSLAELIGESVISAFVGIMTFYLCEYSNVPQVLSAAMIGISAHMSSRTIFLMEISVETLCKRIINKLKGC